MTTRQTHWAVLGLVLLFVSLVPRNADAQIGIFERLSGPGPFFPAFQFPFDRALFCDAGGDKVVLFQSADDTARTTCKNNGAGVRTYVAVEVTHGNSTADDRFPAVAFTGIRPVFFYRLPNPADLLDVGAGVGFNRFYGKDFGFWRTSVPLRARFFVSRPGSRLRPLYVALQADYFPGEFTAADFRSTANFQSDNEFVASIFLGLDLLRLFTEP